jgi:hypothetical protein
VSFRAVSGEIQRTKLQKIVIADLKKAYEGA